jgi:hypothetical protein
VIRTDTIIGGTAIGGAGNPVTASARSRDRTPHRRCAGRGD